MRIDLVSTDISGLSCFDKDQRLELPQRQVCSIIGENQDEGGSNASGKTSFINSVAINLYGPKAVGINAADLKNRHLDVPARICNHYVLDGVSLVIDRTIGGKLKYKYGTSDWKEGKVDDIQAEINNILKITPEQLLFLSHKSQEDTINFLSMKDSEKKDFLGSFFNLEDYEKAKELADLEYRDTEDKINEMNGTIAGISSVIETLHTEIGAAEQILANLTTGPQMEVLRGYEGRISSLNDSISGMSHVLTNSTLIREFPEYQTARELYDRTIRENESKILELSKQINDLVDQKNMLSHQLSASNSTQLPQELSQGLSEVETAIKCATDMMKTKSELAFGISTKKQELTRKKTELHNAMNAESIRCNSCGQELSNQELRRSHVDALNQKIQELSLGLDEAIQTHDKTLVSEEDISALHRIKSEAIGKIAAFRAENNKDSLKSVISALDQQMIGLNREIAITQKNSTDANRNLQNAEQSVVYWIKNQIILKQGSLETAIAEKAMIELKISMAKDDIESRWAKLKLAQQKLEESEQTNRDLKHSLMVLVTAANILSRSGFIGYIFDGMLGDLNGNINAALKNIPNVRKYNVQFTPDKLVKSTGSISKNISFSIKCGKDDINFKTTSGGQKLGLIIAVDEALDEVLSRRLGVQIGWKFLDEQFKWIDANSKESILEFYKLNSANKTYFIVDHASEFNAALDSRIKIVLKNEIARIENG